eukprot:4141161-Prymnesium_polylepis.1
MQLSVRSNGTFFSPGGEGFRLSLHAGGYPDSIRRRAYRSVDWLRLAYAAKSAQEGTVYVDVPEYVAWTQLEHYDVVVDVARRIDTAVGDDPDAANSLTNGFTRAQEYFTNSHNLAATRAASIATVKQFIDLSLIHI